MRLLTNLAATTLFMGAAHADTLYLTDGSTIDGVTVVSEGLLTVTYKDGNKRDEVNSDRVLNVEFERKPQLVDSAETALIDDDLAGALYDLDDYLAAIEEKPERRHQWAPAYAMYRKVQINETMGNSAGVVAAADQLLARAADSRYAPMAILKKAEAQGDLGKASDATAALATLEALIAEKSLSERWRLEHELATLLMAAGEDSKTRRGNLKRVADSAGDAYPVVRNRAQVAMAESLFVDGKLSEAEAIFQDVVADPRADDRTLAAAFTGLGDCLFQKGADLNGKGQDGSIQLQEALTSYMRVVVVYRHELRYVPKAMFYAGRCFQQSNDATSKDRARQLYATLIGQFKGSSWADEARQFR
jgi:hypothetical protein